MQNATEDQRGLLECWALAAIPASCASKGICPEHPVDLITPVPQSGHSSALLQHPGDTQGRRKERSEPGVDLGHGFYSGICEHPALHKPQDRRQGPGASPAELNMGQSLSWPGLALHCQGTARSFRPGKDAKLKFKVGEGAGRARNTNPWMESSDRACTGPNTCTFFRTHVTPLGKEEGRKAPSSSSPSSLPPYLRSHTWSQGKRGAKC